MGESAAWTWQRCVYLSLSLARTHTSQMPLERINMFCTGVLWNSISVLLLSFFLSYKLMRLRKGGMAGMLISSQVPSNFVSYTMVVILYFVQSLS